jgi:hypothetical protein
MENIYKNSIVRTVSTKTVYSIEYRVKTKSKIQFRAKFKNSVK